MLDWCCIAAVNDEDVLASNLAASPMLRADPLRLVSLRGQRSAGAAYNAGLDRTSARICIFAHQDVYLPAGWDCLLAHRVSELDGQHPDWSVAGVYGISLWNAHCGRVWSSGLRREIGVSPPRPVPAQSVDELLIVLDRDSGLRFDPDLPGFHLYGTDIVQQARAGGRTAYVIDAPVVHNSRPVTSLGGDFAETHRFMRRKWRRQLPILTPVTDLTPFGMKHLWKRLRLGDWTVRGRTSPRPPGSELDPAQIAKDLGYE